MLLRAALALLTLSCTVAAQNTVLKFTMDVTNPALVPGNPFTFTWNGGQPSEPVYIVRNYYFGNTPNQDIIYSTEDILSNAPNNGSWTYTVPLDIFAGRYSFSIGYNPFQLSDQTGIFTVSSSQTSKVTDAPPPATTNTAYQSYRGCGLPPLPDFTYTGYQPPCTVTSLGQTRTIYPIVPEGLSASFFGSSYLATAPSITTPSPAVTSSSPATINTAFATGVYAQALQCPVPVTPSNTRLTASGTTTILSAVSCAASTSSISSDGACHSSGYSTFSVSGATSVCCPGGWATTPLNSELYCFTSVDQAGRRAELDERHVSTETLVASPNPLVVISGLVFTSAGIVTTEAIESGGTSSSSASWSTGGMPTATESVASNSTTGSSVMSLNPNRCAWRAVAALVGLFCFL
ncbi:hypothetical protein BKA65DRAFT_484442 [Rhexocercosporidium sp. MPI-PUGE-AT-0058]|nr:hypothetical protein BKA65DRAFT_484442 [Rhexocercosporidium sp. MPI-PUGE-AT-0058]